MGILSILRFGWAFIGPRIGMVAGTVVRNLPLVMLISGLVLGLLVGGYITYKVEHERYLTLKNREVMKVLIEKNALIISREHTINELHRRIDEFNSIRQTLEERTRDAKKKYQHLLNRDPKCNATVGVVRMLNMSIDPGYQPAKDLAPSGAAAPSTVTGGQIAESFQECATRYNEVRKQLIKAHDHVNQGDFPVRGGMP